MHKGVIIGCGGVYKLFDGVGEAWILGSDNIPNKPISFHKEVLIGLKQIKESGVFHRNTINCPV